MLICHTCGKKFHHVLENDPKLKKNPAFCSEWCWFNNKLPKET